MMQTTEESRDGTASAAREAPADRANEPEFRPDSPPRASAPAAPDSRPREIGGRDGPDPTRFGDWEKSGRCIDF
jgi:hypothetical protein